MVKPRLASKPLTVRTHFTNSVQAKGQLVTIDGKPILIQNTGDKWLIAHLPLNGTVYNFDSNGGDS